MVPGIGIQGPVYADADGAGSGLRKLEDEYSAIFICWLVGDVLRAREAHTCYVQFFEKRSHGRFASVFDSIEFKTIVSYRAGKFLGNAIHSRVLLRKVGRYLHQMPSDDDICSFLHKF